MAERNARATPDCHACLLHRTTRETSSERGRDPPPAGAPSRGCSTRSGGRSPPRTTARSPPTSRSWPRPIPAVCGISLATLDGQVYDAGVLVPFTIQSVSKPYVYALALADRGQDAVLEKVGVEPTGDPFNSISLDDRSSRAVQPDGQRRRDRHLDPRARPDPRRAVRAHPLRPLGLRRARARDRRGGVPRASGPPATATAPSRTSCGLPASSTTTSTTRSRATSGSARCW